MSQSNSPIQSTGGNFQCKYLSCNKTFTRKTGQRRHEALVHSDKKIFCQEPDCSYRGGKRRNDFKKHMREKHPGHDDNLFVPEIFNSPKLSQSPPYLYLETPEVHDAASFRPNSTQIEPTQHPASVNQLEGPRFNENIMIANTYSTPPYIPPRPPDDPSRARLIPPASGINPSMILSPTTTSWEALPISEVPIVLGEMDAIDNEFGSIGEGYDMMSYGQQMGMENDVNANYKW